MNLFENMGSPEEPTASADDATPADSRNPDNLPNRVHTLGRVKYCGKWVEMWFEGNADDEHYDMSCKSGRLNDMVYEAGLYDYVQNHGLRGVKVEFKFWDPNWELKCVINDLAPMAIVDVHDNTWYDLYMGTASEPVETARLFKKVYNQVWIDQLLSELQKEHDHGDTPEPSDVLKGVE